MLTADKILKSLGEVDSNNVNERFRKIGDCYFQYKNKDDEYVFIIVEDMPSKDMQKLADELFPLLDKVEAVFVTKTK